MALPVRRVMTVCGTMKARVTLTVSNRCPAERCTVSRTWLPPGPRSCRTTLFRLMPFVGIPAIAVITSPSLSPAMWPGVPAITEIIRVTPFSARMVTPMPP